MRVGVNISIMLVSFKTAKFSSIKIQAIVNAKYYKFASISQLPIPQGNKQPLVIRSKCLVGIPYTNTLVLWRRWVGQSDCLNTASTLTTAHGSSPRNCSSNQTQTQLAPGKPHISISLNIYVFAQYPVMIPRGDREAYSLCAVVATPSASPRRVHCRQIMCNVIANISTHVYPHQLDDDGKCM